MMILELLKKRFAVLKIRKMGRGERLTLPCSCRQPLLTFFRKQEIRDVGKELAV